MTRKYWIVWNEDRTEGFITDNHASALNADQWTDEFWEGTIGVSTLGASFAEIYREDNEAYAAAPSIEAVDLPEIDAGEPSAA